MIKRLSHIAVPAQNLETREMPHFAQISVKVLSTCIFAVSHQPSMNIPVVFNVVNGEKLKCLFTTTGTTAPIMSYDFLSQLGVVSSSINCRLRMVVMKPLPCPCPLLFPILFRVIRLAFNKAFIARVTEACSNDRILRTIHADSSITKSMIAS